MYHALIAVALLFFALGGIACYGSIEELTAGSTVAALLEFVCALILIFKAVIHPESIQVRKVAPSVVNTPQINLPPETR